MHNTKAASVAVSNRACDSVVDWPDRQGNSGSDAGGEVQLVDGFSLVVVVEIPVWFVSVEEVSPPAAELWSSATRMLPI